MPEIRLRRQGTVTAHVLLQDGLEHALTPDTEISDGFEFGYEGQGPLALSTAILQYLGVDTDPHNFMRNGIARLTTYNKVVLVPNLDLRLCYV